MIRISQRDNVFDEMSKDELQQRLNSSQDRLNALELEKTLHQGRWTKKDQHNYQIMRDWIKNRVDDLSSRLLFVTHGENISRLDIGTLNHLLIDLKEKLKQIDSMGKFADLPKEIRKKYSDMLHRKEAIEHYLKGKQQAPTPMEILNR